ncbi:hypothetical protein POM88_055042 [Heracleum sosnowskyi]|uniref:Uncharacterized protein n=1 Tax=Heracleum sosnowskyi TaxID=360622 RepID=A0AAD8GLN9_9APIA|nr:hypothetical protein POM88_055042 [Heracleum sosnowskyi]
MKELLRDNKVGLCSILETRVAKTRVGKVFNNMFRHWIWFSNVESCAKNCRIVVGWDPNFFEVMHLFETDQVIHCLVKQKSSGEHFYCSFIYAANDHVPRRDLWHSLEVFKNLVGDFPWVLLGDFNAMLKEEESAGGIIGHSPAISEFCGCISKIEVVDLHSTGMRFTWAGSPQGVGVVRKLDRVLINGAFLQKFRYSKARFLAPKSSDHSPAILEFGNQVGCHRRSSFKFQNFLAYRKKFLDLVRSGWNYTSGRFLMYRVVQKLKRLKPIFRSEAKACGNLCVKVKDLQMSLENIQLALDYDPFNEGLKTEEYLGVPLVTTRLWHADCLPLIDQVKRQIQAWQNNWLTYAGRMQLALSVLMSMQVYWSSVFILPVSVSNAIEKLVRNFIWGGTEMIQGRSKVSCLDTSQKEQKTLVAKSRMLEAKVEELEAACTVDTSLRDFIKSLEHKLILKEEIEACLRNKLAELETKCEAYKLAASKVCVDNEVFKKITGVGIGLDYSDLSKKEGKRPFDPSSSDPKKEIPSILKSSVKPIYKHLVPHLEEETELIARYEIEMEDRQKAQPITPIKQVKINYPRDESRAGIGAKAVKQQGIKEVKAERMKKACYHCKSTEHLSYACKANINVPATHAMPATHTMNNLHQNHAQCGQPNWIFLSIHNHAFINISNSIHLSLLP